MLGKWTKDAEVHVSQSVEISKRPTGIHIPCIPDTPRCDNQLISKLLEGQQVANQDTCYSHRLRKANMLFTSASKSKHVIHIGFGKQT